MERKLYKNRANTAEEIKGMRKTGPLGREGAREVMKKIQKDSDYIKDKVIAQLEGKLHRSEKENAALSRRIRELESEKTERPSDIKPKDTNESLAADESLEKAKELLIQRLGNFGTPEFFLNGEAWLVEPGGEERRKYVRKYELLTKDPNIEKVVFIIEDRAVIVGLGLEDPDQATLGISVMNMDTPIPNAREISMTREAFFKMLEKEPSEFRL